MNPANPRIPLPVVGGRQPTSIINNKPLTRQCGGCTACCHIIAVESLGKPYGCDCRHQTAKGCGIYETRPEDCVIYECLWLAGMGLPRDRPDRNGLMFGVRVDAGRVYVDVHETKPGAIASHDTKYIQRLLVAAKRTLLPVLRDDLSGVCLFPHGRKVGMDFPAGQDYPEAPRGNMTFSEVRKGSGILVYLGADAGNGMVETAAGPADWKEVLALTVKYFEDGP